MKRLILVWIIGVLILLLIATVVACDERSEAPTPAESEIPAHFTTYTNKQDLFSISYPSDWELYFHTEEEWEYSANKIINSIEADVPLERSHGYQIAGLPATGYMPGVQVTFHPLPEGVVTLKEFCDYIIADIKSSRQDYYEHSRVETMIDNREATIIDYEANSHSGRLRVLILICMRTNTVAGGVGCASFIKEFSKWEDDFHHIIRSFRILK